MRAFKNIFAIGFTIAVICLGFFLPEFISFAQDENNLERVDRYETNQVTLDISTPTDLSDAFEMVSGGYRPYILEEGKVMQSDDVIGAIQGFQFSFAEWGFEELSPSYYTTYKVQPVLAVSDSAEEGIILWECEVTVANHPDSSISLIVDDTSGVIVQFGASVSTDVVDWTDAIPMEDKAFVWAEAWSNYWGHGYTVIDEDSQKLVLSEQDQKNMENGVAVEAGYVTSLTIMLDDIRVRIGLDCDAYMKDGSEEPFDGADALEEEGDSSTDVATEEGDLTVESEPASTAQLILLQMFPA